MDLAVFRHNQVSNTCIDKMDSSTASKKLTIMVSTSVYGVQDLLDQIFAVLESFGYEVWMSHKGTIPVNPGRSAFDNCLDAVEICDAFLGIITGWYGSGMFSGDLGITHRELLRAIELDKPRWFLVHHDVKVARLLLNQFRLNDDGTPRPLDFQKTAILSDIRVLDMCDAATRNDLPLPERTGNWVQEYANTQDALRFINTQFGEPDRLRAFLVSAIK